MASMGAYETSVREVSELFSDYLEGDASRPALALSTRPLPENARNALERSFERFGFEPPNCTYATLFPTARQAEGSDIALDAQALFLLVESLDPLRVIAADAEASRTLAQAYRASYPLDAPIRAFGRPGAAFENLPQLLETPSGKQKAWSVLRSLRT